MAELEEKIQVLEPLLQAKEDQIFEDTQKRDELEKQCILLQESLYKINNELAAYKRIINM